MRRSTLPTLCIVALLFSALLAPMAMARDGTPTSATVSFGAWHTDPPLDRFPNSSPADRNEHQLIPFNVTIEAGGTVNFIISGLHQVIVYDDGTRPDDIDTTLTTTTHWRHAIAGGGADRRSDAPHLPGPGSKLVPTRPC